MYRTTKEISYHKSYKNILNCAIGICASEVRLGRSWNSGCNLEVAMSTSTISAVV